VANAAARSSSSTFSGACDDAALPDSRRRAPDGNDPAATARAVPYRGLTALLLLVVLVRVLTWGRCKPKNAATSGRRNRTSETASAKRLRRMGRKRRRNGGKKSILIEKIS